MESRTRNRDANSTPEACRIIGPYRVLCGLGRGSMGSIYRAEHRHSGKIVALKTLELPSEAFLPSLRREIDALSRLKHPGIVRILDSGAQHGVPWYAMELVDGQTLRQHRGSLQSLLDLAYRLCEALAYLHGEGLIHRDLKPDNVVVRRDGQPVLVDFGVAAEFSAPRLSRDTLLVEHGPSGTPLYMAPEQFLGNAVDARADLYALGCILHEALSGRPPFQGSLWQVRQGHLEQPAERLCGQPEALTELVARLLTKDPRQRPGYASDVAAALVRIGANAAPAARRLPPSYLYRPGFTGRGEAIAMLQAQLSQLRHGKGGLVLVGGESGVGKTRLATEIGRLAAREGIRVLTGECLPGVASGRTGDGGNEGVSGSHDSERGAQPMGMLLQAWRGPLQQVADRCREHGTEETARLLGVRARLLEPYEPSLAGLPGLEAIPPPAELPAQAATLRLYMALSRTFTELCRIEPVLLLLDDLHWADELSLGFLEFLARADSAATRWAAPLLIVGTYRTEEGREELRRLVHSGRAEHLCLERLDEPTVGAMVRDMLALPATPERFVRFLTRQTEGNPFFVAEYLRAAVAAELLYRDAEGYWQVAEPGQVEATDEAYAAMRLPGSLQALVLRRLDGLGTHARRLADAASVLGRDVEEDLLAGLVRMSGSKRMQAIRELLRREVIEEGAAGRLRFVHDKIREVVYASLRPERRRRLHRAAASALEARAGAESLQSQAALGHHWQGAGEPDRARPCYLQAARDAVARHAHAEAERLYRAYLRLVETPTSESVEAHNELGERVLRIQGRMPRAIEQHRLALEEARRLGDRAGLAQTSRKLGICLYEIGQLEQAGAQYDEALKLARALGDLRLEGITLGSQAILQKTLGRFEEARRLYERALAVHRDAGQQRDTGITLGNLALLHAELGHPREARELYEQALSSCRTFGDRRTEGIHLCNLALLEATQGNFTRAHEIGEQALSILREVGERRIEATTLTNLAAAFIDAGDLDAGRRLSEQALAIHRDVGNLRMQATTLHNLAGVALQDGGDPDEARALLQQALALARETRHLKEVGIVLRDMAALERRAGLDLALAQSLLLEAEAVLTEVGATVELALCLCERGYLELAQSRVAKPALRRASELGTSANIGSGSALGQELARLERTIVAFEAGQPLFRGQCQDDLPRGLRRWLDDNGRLPAA